MTVQVEVKNEVVDVTPQEEQYEFKSEGTFIKGDRGASAYEVAVANGFEGSEAEWLESLKGDLSDEEVAEIVKQAATLVKVPTTAKEVGADPEGSAAQAYKASQTYTDNKIAAIPTPDVSGQIDSHNTNTEAHNDIRILLLELQAVVTAFLDTDEETMNELSELIIAIGNNKTSIEALTTGKVNVTDIIDNLETNLATKPLSAAQGTVLNKLISDLRTAVNNISVPTKMSQLTDDVGFAKQSDLEKQSEEIADLSLGMGEDGRLYLLNGGVAQGNGIELPSGATGDVIGNIGEGNIILLSGDIPDGTYTVKYEMENGNVINIGNMVLDSNVYYSVIKNLTNCTINNNATQAVKGGSYSATITPNDGYELKSVAVTMGGSAVSVSGGNISIANVTGNIVITAVAEVAGPAYTNQIPLSIDTDGTPFNGGQGWKTGYRLSLSSGGETTTSGYECTGYIPVKYGDVVRIKNIDLTAENSTNMVFYDSDKNPIKNTNNYYGGQLAAIFTSDSNGAYKATMNTNVHNTLTSSLAFIRIGSKSITADSILTINQEIV